MLEAALWGLVGGLALVAGAVFGLVRGMSKRSIAYVMAFGAGVLISAVAFDLTEEAIEIGSGGAAAGGLLAGAFVYFAGSRMLKRRSGDEDSGGAIVLGALLDGIPESAAIGVTLIGGGGVSVSFVVAVFLSNLPESISATSDLKRDHSARWILTLWLAIAIAAAASAAIGYGALGDASGNLLAWINAFAGGAILCMLADTFMPNAYRDGGDKVGLVTVLGFALAALLSTAS